MDLQLPAALTFPSVCYKRHKNSPVLLLSNNVNGFFTPLSILFFIRQLQSLMVSSRPALIKHILYNIGTSQVHAIYISTVVNTLTVSSTQDMDKI